MSIKMIVTDLDGTLFRSDKTISQRSKAVIARCQAEGIRFVVATARMKRLVDHFIPDMRLDGCIYHNGASVFYGGEEIAAYKIRAEAVRKTIGSIRNINPEAKIAVQANNAFYANFDAAVMTKASVMIQHDISELPDMDADKINILMSNASETAKYEKLLGSDLYIVCSENTFGMIMRKDATKQGGIKAIANAAGVELSEIAAFGDDFNDLDMIRACGTGIAVANAIEEVKLAANDICASNDDDGVARWLEENVLA